jgi:hypothetical protein
MKKVEQTKATTPTVRPIKPRRKFDSSFKCDAVTLWLSSGKSAREIGAELGIRRMGVAPRCALVQSHSRIAERALKAFSVVVGIPVLLMLIVITLYLL